MIDNNSTDGTTQWLKSIVVDGYYKIKPIFLDYNSGDFGGTKLGYENLDDDCVYTMQWDNDRPPITENFLDKIVNIMDAFRNIGQLMLKRTGVGNIIQPINIQEYNGVFFGDVNTVTCVNIQRRKVIDDINYWVCDESVYWDFMINQEMLKRGYQLKKCLNVIVSHIDVFPELNFNLQKLKFPNYFNNKSKINYTEIDYNCDNNEKK